MKAKNEISGILNSLIFINGERINGYQKALKTINGNSSYESVFKRMIKQSINNRQELISIRESTGDAAGYESTRSERINGVWTDVRSKYSGDADIPSLELCEYDERAAQMAYEKTLNLYANLPRTVREVITRQKDELIESHELIKTQWVMEQALS